MLRQIRIVFAFSGDLRLPSLRAGLMNQPSAHALFSEF